MWGEEARDRWEGGHRCGESKQEMGDGGHRCGESKQGIEGKEGTDVGRGSKG